MAVNDANYSHRTPGTLYKSYNLVLKFSIQQSYFFSERITSISLFNVSSKEWEMRCTAHVKSPTTLSNLSTRKEYHKNLYHEKKKKGLPQEGQQQTNTGAQEPSDETILKIQNPNKRQ